MLSTHFKELRMAFFTSFFKSKMDSLHDGAIKLMASWDPAAVSAAQLREWDTQSQEMAEAAARAQTEAKTAGERLAHIQTNLSRYTAAAEKLMTSGNETAANKAADEALKFQSQLKDAEEEAADAAEWAAETRQAAENAQRLVVEGRQKLDRARRDQERAEQEARVAEARRAERERVAGITKGLSGTDAALDAMAANARAARERASASRIRSDALGKATDSDSAVAAALAEVDGKGKSNSLQEKLAALRGQA
jgi:phage shock protein A